MQLLAGTADGLYRLGRAGAERVADGDVAALAVDGERVWAVLDGTTVASGEPQGGLAPVATHGVALRCLAWTGVGLLAGTAGADLVRLDGDELVAVPGFGSVAGRERWHTPWGGPPDTRSLAAGPDGTLYANVHVGGIPRSSDGGATWQPTIDIDADVHEVAVHDGLVLTAAALGPAISTDRGATWRWRTEDLHATYARAVVAAGDAMVVSVSEGPGGRRAALYRGPLSGSEPLTRCRQGLPEWFSGNVDTGCLTAHGRQVAAADGGTVYASEDAGESWRDLAVDLAPVRCLAALA